MGAEVPLRVPRHPVHPNARWLWAIEGMVGSIVLVLGAAVISFAVPGDAPAAVRVPAGVLPWLTIPLVALLVLAQPLWRYRVHRWEVTEAAVYTLEGWFTRTWRIVPIARIQTVDTTRGPLQQLLGLATIIVRTASHAGSTDVQHLDAAVADAVAHDLALRANAVRDEAT